MSGTYRTPSPMRGVDHRPGKSMAASSDFLTLTNSPSMSPMTGLSEPSTPTRKRLQIGWHGLLSPQTPTVTDPRCASNDTVEAGNTKTAQDISNETQASNAVLMSGSTQQKIVPIPAPQLAIVPPKKKVKASATLTDAIASTSASTLAIVSAPSLTFSDATASPFNVALSPSDVLLELHSSEWQLQYPPGGSTHPSYPWPMMDPRLVFKSHFVPINDGLPDISQAPALFLPIGWKHVSWSGLLPVVFDPYRQGFKLTPVGPMPLTCEELQQGGLYRYVPGGDLHPEFGLLPELSAISDGSDAEFINFEGMDWELPWSAQDLTLALQADFEHAASSLKHNDSASPVYVSPPTTSWVEARDCPDNIIDIEDAWRWLMEKEQKSDKVFTPSPGKTWWGSGVGITSRLQKAPIPSLMSSTLANIMEDPIGYLGKQNGREFCPFKSVATPVHVDITLLRDTEFTLMEFLCYFPSHFAWRKGADRLANSGMTALNVVSTLDMTRGLPGDGTPSKTTIDKYMWSEPETPESKKRVKIVRSGTEMTTYTAEDWAYTTWETSDYPLLGLAHGLLELPTGVDAGPITALIHWCRSNGRYTAMLSDVPSLLQEANIEPLIEPGDTGCPDKDVVVRLAEPLKEDRRRVLRSMAEKKRQLEDGEGKKSRKRKFE
ncbi:hypothetical protein P153DRAFT_424167 [Dothidotthia symphoricarpi CBS 119687]|uniref:Uncharacterized protein n=1 Tax=Dothidotthia symphoricarpi CBS 119687 TaxID=1392245 RepID=A0A6A6A6K6_9PLEO|nr:uncharacterized protein P153DRAFT_424167 [Dothidotthia symphoricarpi CBS 119687]KAF2127519.1 hypothetical protein P153DRAFT_424167 [Dothidotthia symphoricarpi CBS 119687]